MNSKFDSTLLPLPFVLHLRSPNCFSADVPEEEKQKTVKGIAVRRRSLVWIAPVVLVLALAGWFWSKRGTEPAAANEETKIKATLNLADRDQKSYLRVGIDLGLRKEAGKSESAPSVAQVRDTILSVLGLAEVNELLTATGKIQLKADLLKALQVRMPELGVEEIYFTEFLIQR
jgi:flagellar basal body-associated protein FliL